MRGLALAHRPLRTRAGAGWVSVLPGAGRQLRLAVGRTWTIRK